MDLLFQILLTFGMCVATGFATWFFARLKTPKEQKSAAKEQKKTDSVITNETIENLLKSIENALRIVESLTNKYSEVQQQLIDKSKELLLKEIENGELAVQIVELQKEISGLQKLANELKTQIQNLINQNKKEKK